MTKAAFSPLVARRNASPAKTAASARHPGAPSGLPRFLSASAVLQRSSERTSGSVTASSVRATARPKPNQLQTASSLQVSSPSDPAEVEAERVAHHVMHMPATPAGTTTSRAERPSLLRMTEGTVARKATAGTGASGEVVSEISASRGAGTPLPPTLRRFMEPRFGARFDKVRIHTGERAERLNRQVSAHAFTVGPDIFFGRGKYEPDNPAGRELIAHELTHTIQQGAVAQDGVLRRSADVEVCASTTPQIQRVLSPREFIAEKAEAIPGWTMLTVVIGYNPISGQDVDRNAGNILKGAIQLIPGGNYITDALNNHGVFDKASEWASQQFNALKDIASSLRGAVGKVIDELKFSDILHPIEAWDRSKRIFTDPIDRIKAFAINLKDGIVELIKDAILKPIAAFAKEKTNGYDLLCAIMGKDPISGDPAPDNAEAFIGGFLKFIGENETWERMKQANAIPRITAWFKSTMGELKRFVNEIPGLFITAFKSLEIIDIILIPRAFIKLATVFGGFAAKFISWGAGAVWTLLEIIFDVVSPGALGYIKKTGAAIKSIFKNPLPFMGNLVQAGKLGFQNFAGNFLTHLKAGLIDWLTGSLPGIYIPTAFTLQEILKFVLSVLGLSWANIRQKLVKVVGETAVKAMETGFDIVVTLVTQGPAAAWEKIKDQLGNLKDMVIGGITDFVVEMVVTKAVPKLVAMFIPGAGFLSAIVTIYDTVMVFVNKISKIIQVVTGFINSIVAIAAGQIGAAASKVESILAGLLSLAINFLAGFAGLGKVADKVMGVIQKIRAPIDKALDWLVNWIATTAKKLFAKAFGKQDKKPGIDTTVAVGQQETAELDSKGVKAAVGRELKGKVVSTTKDEEALVAAMYSKYQPKGLKSIRFQPSESGISVLVGASLVEEVAKLDLNSKADQRKLLTLMQRFRYLTKSTYIYTYYAGAKVDSVSNHAGHAERDFVYKSIGKVETLILADLRIGKLTPTSQVTVGLSMTRTPCNGCATYRVPEAIAVLKQNSQIANMDIRLSIEATALTSNILGGSQGLEKLLSQPNVEVKASDFWSVIIPLIESHQFYDEVTTEHWRADQLRDFQYGNNVLRAEIDAIVERKKSEPKIVSKG